MMIDVRDVWKRYPGAWALRGVSFQVARGRVQGVLGENGSGKSTLFRILAGLTRPSRGSAEVMGQAVSVKTRQHVAYLAEINPFLRLDEGDGAGGVSGTFLSDVGYG